MEEMKICSTACKLFIHLFISHRLEIGEILDVGGRWRRILIVLVLSIQHYKLACCSSYVDIWIYLCMDEYDFRLHSIFSRIFTQWYRYVYICWQKICRHLVIKLFSVLFLSLFNEGGKKLFFCKILSKIKSELKKMISNSFRDVCFVVYFVWIFDDIASWI